MANMTLSERQLILEAQVAFGEAKVQMNIVRARMTALGDILQTAGNAQAAAAAYSVKAQAGLARGQIEVAHAVGSVALAASYSDGGVVIFGGGGGR